MNMKKLGIGLLIVADLIVLWMLTYMCLVSRSCFTGSSSTLPGFASDIAIFVVESMLVIFALAFGGGIVFLIRKHRRIAVILLAIPALCGAINFGTPLISDVQYRREEIRKLETISPVFYVPTYLPKNVERLSADKAFSCCRGPSRTIGIEFLIRDYTPDPVLGEQERTWAMVLEVSAAEFREVSSEYMALSAKTPGGVTILRRKLFPQVGNGYYYYAVNKGDVVIKFDVPTEPDIFEASKDWDEFLKVVDSLEPISPQELLRD